MFDISSKLPSMKTPLEALCTEAPKTLPKASAGPWVLIWITKALSPKNMATLWGKYVETMRNMFLEYQQIVFFGK